MENRGLCQDDDSLGKSRVTGFGEKQVTTAMEEQGAWSLPAAVANRSVVRASPV